MQDTQFYNDLAWSAKQSERLLWIEAYKRYFGIADLETMLVKPLEGKSDHGIDKIIRFPNGTNKTVDEKIHRDNGRGFKDNLIFLEVADINEDGTFRRHGWIMDESKECDYLAYAKESTEQVYIFPFKEIQEAWRRHGADWELRYQTTRTHNTWCWTECLLVPADEISEAIHRNFVISVPSEFWT